MLDKSSLPWDLLDYLMTKSLFHNFDCSCRRDLVCEYDVSQGTEIYVEGRA